MGLRVMTAGAGAAQGRRAVRCPAPGRGRLVRRYPAGSARRPSPVRAGRPARGAGAAGLGLAPVARRPLGRRGPLADQLVAPGGRGPAGPAARCGAPAAAGPVAGACGRGTGSGGVGGVSGVDQPCPAGVRRRRIGSTSPVLRPRRVRPGTVPDPVRESEVLPGPGRSAPDLRVPSGSAGPRSPGPPARWPFRWRWPVGCGAGRGRVRGRPGPRRAQTGGPRQAPAGGGGVGGRPPAAVPPAPVRRRRPRRTPRRAEPPRGRTIGSRSSGPRPGPRGRRLRRPVRSRRAGGRPRPGAGRPGGLVARAGIRPDRWRRTCRSRARRSGPGRRRPVRLGRTGSGRLDAGAATRGARGRGPAAPGHRAVEPPRCRAAPRRRPPRRGAGRRGRGAPAGPPARSAGRPASGRAARSRSRGARAGSRGTSGDPGRSRPPCPADPASAADPSPGSRVALGPTAAHPALVVRQPGPDRRRRRGTRRPHGRGDAAGQQLRARASGGAGRCRGRRPSALLAARLDRGPPTLVRGAGEVLGHRHRPAGRRPDCATGGPARRA